MHLFVGNRVRQCRVLAESVQLSVAITVMSPMDMGLVGHPTLSELVEVFM